MKNIFTVDVEEYFQVEAFSEYIEKKDWDNYPGRVEEPTNRLLEILDTYQVRGTFFVLGWLAERHPGLVKKISDLGHEVASHGYEHTMITKMTPEEFRKDIRRSKGVLEEITQKAVLGYRAPTFSLVEKTSWAYEILLEEGYSYSSSVYPIHHDRYGWPKFGHIPREVATNENGGLWEIPLSVAFFEQIKIPFGGGGYLRFYPLFITRKLIRNFNRKEKPVIVYIHPWELDSNQPKIQVPFSTHIRHYLGIARMERKLRGILQSGEFGTVANFLEGKRSQLRDLL